MADLDPKTPRERYRAQVREEIKKYAWEQIATAGASALSLNAIAKRMGMSGPALYRYYASRDELFTELITDAYRSLLDAMSAQAAAGADLAALGLALRRWALDDPQRYLLVYGTPVPGYHAPADTTRISGEIMAILLDASVASVAAQPPAASLDQHLAEHRAWAGSHQASPPALHLALTFWTRLHGVLSLELAGHFTGMGFDPTELYTAEIHSLTAG